VKGAIKLCMLGHRDLIANILYGITATQEDMKFLIIDEALKAFIKSRNLRSDVFISLGVVLGDFSSSRLCYSTIVTERFGFVIYGSVIHAPFTYISACRPPIAAIV
jgi:hypothetical protein